MFDTIMTIEILGLGESLSEYQPNENLTIGVNDIHSRIKTDYVVCVDNFEAFTKERLNTILKSQCKGFYSQLECWRNIPNFKRIELHRLAKLTDEKFRYSNNSTFVACVLAYKLGAKKIILWGVDFRTHQNFKGNSYTKAIEDFKQLKKDLHKLDCKLIVGSEYSALHGLI
jgi:hypothetical protein